MSLKPALRFFANVLPFMLWMSLMFLMSTDLGGTNNSLKILLKFLHLLPSGEAVTAHEAGFLDHWLRKTAHFTEYAILAWLGYRAARFGVQKSVRSALRFGWLAAVLFAISDEIHQSFVPGRTAQFRDVVIDALGASFAIYLLSKRNKIALAQLLPRSRETK